MADTVVMH